MVWMRKRDSVSEKEREKEEKEIVSHSKRERKRKKRQCYRERDKEIPSQRESGWYGKNVRTAFIAGESEERYRERGREEIKWMQRQESVSNTLELSRRIFVSELASTFFQSRLIVFREKKFSKVGCVAAILSQRCEIQNFPEQLWTSG